MRPLRACVPAALALALTACGGEASTSATSTSVVPGTASSSAGTAPTTTTTTPSTTAAASTPAPSTTTSSTTAPAPTTTTTPSTTAPAPATTAAPAGSALTAADAARILVTADQLPGGPWEAGPVQSQAEPWFPPLGDTSQAGTECRSALDRLVAASQEAPTAHASRTFHGRGFVPEQVRATLESRADAAQVPGLLTAVASACRSATLLQGGEQTHLAASPVQVGTPGGAATKVTSTRQGRTLALVFGAVGRGQTLSFVVADGPQAVTAVPQVLQAQTSRLEHAPR